MARAGTEQAKLHALTPAAAAPRVAIAGWRQRLALPVLQLAWPRHRILHVNSCRAFSAYV